ncbi:MAG: hypothetical protein QNJ08_15450 [Crocosphaera sp.]|nr:hypothetical protein [Crocosphaera sp.]
MATNFLFTDILHQYRKIQQQKTENKLLSSYHQNKPCYLFPVPRSPFPVPCSLSKLASFIEGARYEFTSMTNQYEIRMKYWLVNFCYNTQNH